MQSPASRQINERSAPHRTRSILTYVLALSAAIAVPVFCFMAVLASKWVASEQSAITETVRGLAKDAAAQVDSYIAGQIAMLQALATSPAIDQNDFAFLDSQMRELARINETFIVLRSQDGSRPVDTRYSSVVGLRKIPLTPGEVQILKSKSAFVSDLFETDVAARTPVVRVSVPVIRDGEVKFVIAARLPAAKLASILRESGVATPHSGAITDRSGRIIASADGSEARIGSDWLSHVNPTVLSGDWITTGPDGGSVYTGYRRSELSGWSVGVGVDADRLDAPLRDSLWTMGLLGLCLVVLVLIVSGLIAWPMIAAQRKVLAAAVAVGNRETIVAPGTAFRETNLVGEALSEASVRLRDQADALEQANRELETRVASRTSDLEARTELLRATLDNMTQGLIMVDADGRVAICNPRAMELLDLPADFMASRPLFKDVVQFQIDQGEFTPADLSYVQERARRNPLPPGEIWERVRPNQTVIEIRTVPLAGGGAIRTYTDVTARREVERQAVYLARHDPLTGLPNRTLLFEHLQEDFATGRSFSLLLIDLDRFKAVNDMFGHPIGDALLCMVTERIRSVLGEEDALFRLGGDEFAIRHFEATNRAAPRELAGRIEDELCRPFLPNGQQVRIGASIGIATAPNDGDDPDSILRSADLALYQVKSTGDGGHRIFEPAMAVIAKNRDALEKDFRQALEGGALELHYQPVISLHDGGVDAFEALARWNHPTRGMIPPDVFIPMAEERHLIIQLGQWALSEACRMVSKWPERTRVLVNISPIQLEDVGFVPSVVATVTAAGISPGRVQLEITETALIRESELVLRSLESLREFGVTIALDDFGTGYSSLTYLREFPLDTVKIDRSFVRCFEDPRSAAIMSAITSLAREFEMTVTAEGIETRSQLDFVRSIGCTHAQGYLFGKPMPAKQAGDFTRTMPGASAA